MSKTWSVEEHDAASLLKDRSWPTRVALRIIASRLLMCRECFQLIQRALSDIVQPLDPSTFEWRSATTQEYQKSARPLRLSIPSISRMTGVSNTGLGSTPGVSLY